MLAAYYIWQKFQGLPEKLNINVLNSTIFKRIMSIFNQSTQPRKKIIKNEATLNRKKPKQKVKY